MDCFIDIELVFEIRSLQLGLVKRRQFVDNCFLDQVYYKPVYEGFKALGYEADRTEVENYSATIKFKLEGWHLLDLNKNNKISLIGEIEENLYENILKANNFPIIPQISNNELMLTIKLGLFNGKIITSQESVYSAALESKITADLIPLEGKIDFPYDFSGVP